MRVKKNKSAKTIKFQPMNIECTFTGHPSVLEVAIAHNIPLNHSCGGMGSCTTCLVHIKEGLEKVGPRQELESEHAQMRGFKGYERLSCQITAKDGLTIYIPSAPQKEIPQKS